MLGQRVNWDYQWGQIVGRAWADDDFKERLRADPAGVLAEYGLTPPGRVEVVAGPDAVAEEVDGVLRLVLPAKPSAEELSDEELCSVGAGGAVARCGDEWCRCEACRRCREFCRCGGCHHPPRPDEN